MTQIGYDMRYLAIFFWGRFFFLVVGQAEVTGFTTADDGDDDNYGLRRFLNR